jgi:hypothetical protein
LYTVYKTINRLNDKTYIGVHKTDDPNDSYLGSGRAILEAIKKHGKENFFKEILLITDDRDEAYAYERTLTIDYNCRDNYNMRLGGVGGFTRENALKGHRARSVMGGLAARDKKSGFHSLTKEQLSAAGKKGAETRRKRKLASVEQLVSSRCS